MCVLLNVVDGVAIVLGVAVPGSYSVDAFADMLVAIIIDILPGIGVDVLTDVNANALVIVMTVKFAMTTSLEYFNG